MWKHAFEKLGEEYTELGGKWERDGGGVRERDRDIKEREEGWIGPTPGTCSFLQ